MKNLNLTKKPLFYICETSNKNCKLFYFDRFDNSSVREKKKHIKFQQT